MGEGPSFFNANGRFSSPGICIVGIDKLHFTFAVFRFAVRHQPDVSGNARVVEHLRRHGDNRLQPVVLDNPLADVAFA